MLSFLKAALRRALQRRGYELYRRPWLPKGVDPFESLRAIWPGWQPRLIFDVGANTGQTIARLHAMFATAEIHAFEPVPATHALLQAAIAQKPRLHAHCLALSDREGELLIAEQSESTLNSLAFSTSVGGVRVALKTAATFCHLHNIPRIDLLKIDVEGTELAVLRGAQPLFAAHRVGFVLVEAGLTPGDSRFTPLPALAEFLSANGYHLVGLYEQHGWHHFHAAEFCNALFAPDDFIRGRTA